MGAYSCDQNYAFGGLYIMDGGYRCDVYHVLGNYEL